MVPIKAGTGLLQFRQEFAPGGLLNWHSGHSMIYCSATLEDLSRRQESVFEADDLDRY
jgi:hypothetical protein